jgi:uncharacterized protein (TIGR02452 family)
MTRDLETIGRETLEILADGGYQLPSGRAVALKDDVDAAVAGTALHREEQLAARVAHKQKATSGRAQLSCWRERSGACASRLLEAGARHVAVLNYASGVKPGGGFLHGASAQEESLCRCSALYPCLAGDRADTRAFYVENRAKQSALVTGHILVSPRVPFFRSEDMALLEQPFVATVLTAAAPDLGWLFATTEEGLEPKARFEEVPGVFAQRTQYVLEAARGAGCDAVVVGPWGCGAFGNDAEMVADAFRSAVERYADAFDRIVFSTWGPAQNRDAFERRFKQGYLWDVG